MFYVIKSINFNSRQNTRPFIRVRIFIFMLSWQLKSSLPLLLLLIFKFLSSLLTHARLSNWSWSSSFSLSPFSPISWDACDYTIKYMVSTAQRMQSVATRHRMARFRRAHFGVIILNLSKSRTMMK